MPPLWTHLAQGLRAPGRSVNTWACCLWGRSLVPLVLAGSWLSGRWFVCSVSVERTNGICRTRSLVLFNDPTADKARVFWKKDSIKKWIILHCTVWHCTSYVCRMKVKWETVTLAACSWRRHTFPSPPKSVLAGTMERNRTALGVLWGYKPTLEFWMDSLPPSFLGVKKVRVRFPHKKEQVAWFSLGKVDAFLPTGSFRRTLRSLLGVSSVWLCKVTRPQRHGHTEIQSIFTSRALFENERSCTFSVNLTYYMNRPSVQGQSDFGRFLFPPFVVINSSNSSCLFQGRFGKLLLVDPG